MACNAGSVSHASSVQHVERMGTASVMDEKSPEAEHVDCEHGEPEISAHAVSSQHATAVEQTIALVEELAAPQEGCVHALEM